MKAGEGGDAAPLIREIQRYLAYVEALRSGRDTGDGPAGRGGAGS